LVLFPPGFCQELSSLQKIKQVELLYDKYDDVIRIMGNPSRKRGPKELIEHFDLKDGQVNAIFESGRCVLTEYSDGKPLGWKVPEWTISDISFRPRKRVSPRKLGLETKGFDRVPIADVPGAFIFRNEDLGMEYSVTREGKVYEISFFPAKKFDYLLCQ
jgi:hypothetical protein